MDTTRPTLGKNKQQDQKVETQTEKNNDINKRRYINCGNAKNNQDYITRADLIKAFPNWSGHV